MFYTPTEGSDLKEMAYAGYDGDATRLICAKLKEFYAGYKSETELGELTSRVAALRGNLHLVEKYVPELANVFARAADLQDEWIAGSELKLAHGRPHHDNMKYSEGQWNLTQELPILAPEAHDYAFVVTNPYTFNRTWQQNLELSAGPGRLEIQMGVIAAETGIYVQEQAKAVLCHSFTTAAKRFWEMNDNENKGNGPVVNAGQVEPQFFIEFAKRVAPLAGFDWK